MKLPADVCAPFQTAGVRRADLGFAYRQYSALSPELAMPLPTAWKPLMNTRQQMYGWAISQLLSAGKRVPRSAQVRTAALVGNGPVSPAQRELIASMDVIVRFNVPNSFAPNADERMTVWVVRHAAAAARRGYWGPEQLDDAVSERLIQSAEVRACQRELAPSAVMYCI